MSYGITLSSLVLSVVEISKEESEDKKFFFKQWPKFSNFDWNYKPADPWISKNSKQKEHEENCIKAHYHPIAQSQPDKNDTLCTSQQYSYRKKCKQGDSRATFLKYQKGEKNCQVRILYPAKRYFKHKDEIYFSRHKS